MRGTMTTLALCAFALPALAGGHATPMIEAADQSVGNGIVSASKIVAAENDRTFRGSCRENDLAGNDPP